MVENRCSVQREGVYRWFSVLSSAQRAEFICGLLDLCVPIELRFLGSCLEDLARKDYYSLRDAEIKANNPADLSNLTNITDEVVRSKLLVSLALLSSDNREAAGVLYRTLTHIDTIINNYGLQLNDGQTEEQFLLLFTMASNHPAFSFHQKQVLRKELSQLQGILQPTCGGEPQGGGGGTVGLACLSSPLACAIPATFIPASACQAQCPCCHKSQQHKEVLAGPGPRLGAGPGAGRGDQGIGPDPVPHPPSTPCQERPCKVHLGKPGKVNVERIELRGVSYQADKPSEYKLEVSWCDSSVSTVVRSHQEVLDLLSQVSKVFPDEGLDKLLPQSPDLDPAPELDRCLTTLPPHVLRHHHVSLFFSSASPAPAVPVGPSTPPAPSGSFPHTANLGCLLQYRGSHRTVCGVASIQPVMSVHTSIQPRSPPQLAHLPPQPPPHLPPQVPMPVPPPGGVATAGGETGPPPTGHLHNLAQQPQPTSPEQNGILDWLRKLRLHKYYPVFKQLTMEEFLALTEEDLNKYDLTQGAKKKLKTQLELQKEKMEKRHLMSQFPVSCGGIARVTPSSHMVSVAHLHSTAHAELRVEVDTGGSHAFHRDGSSSSGYSSAPCSPMAPLCRDAAFDRAKDAHRRMESGPDPSGGDKERTCVPLSPSAPAGPSRPTAQVLPVQNDPTPCPSHLSLPPPPLPLLSPAPGRLLGSPRKPRPPPLCAEERAKSLGSGSGVRLESLFPGLNLDSPPPPPPPSLHLQESQGPRGPPASSALRSPPETSTSLTSTSTTLHRVSHPPLPLQVSPSLPRASGHYPYPSSPSNPSSSASSLSPSFPSAGSVPMAVVPGNTYCVNSVSAAPPSSSSPASSAEGGYALGSSPGASPSSVCVCSSCGCRGNCGSYGALPGGYAGYFQHPFSGTSVFTLGPLLHLSPLLATSGTAGAFSYPLVAPPLYNSTVSHDPPSPQQQQGLVLPPMQGFLGGGASVYQPHGMLGNGGYKRVGNLSCYNCGASGHRAQECKQPPMDSLQQGMFRLKYSPHSDSKDSGD